MFLPNTDTKISDLCKMKGVNPSNFKNMVESGTAGVLLDAWTAYSVAYMKNRDVMENLTPVGGLCLGREIFEQIIEDFQEELVLFEKNEEKEE